MKMILLAAATAAALVVPTGAVAKPDNSERKAAKAECKAERGKNSATREAFRMKYRGFRACVRKKAADEEAENETAHKNAAKECKAEGLEGRAYGKCVSTKAREKKAEEDAEDAKEAKEFRNAAKECKGEGLEGRAFGKCVSQKVRES